MKNMKSMKSGQAGFTLIELVVVIVILGILAATALPRFTGMQREARIASLNAARGAVVSAVALARAKSLAANSAAVDMDGTPFTLSAIGGFPAFADIRALAGLSEEYTVSGTTISVTSAPTAANCSFTYTAATGVVSTATVTGC